MSTFEDFLTDCMDQGHTQVKLVPRINAHGSVAFYAVGQCGPISGETFDAVMVDGEIINMTQPEAPVDTEVKVEDFPPEMPDPAEDGE